MAIDVGDACSDRGDVATFGVSYIFRGNPANDTGTIDTVCIWANTGNDIAGLEYAAFVHEGSNVYSTHGDTNGSNLSASGETTHTAAGNDFTAFAITSGDNIGAYATGGRIEFDYSGSLGNMYASGDQVPCSSVTFSLDDSNSAGSLYATGTEAGGAVAPTGALYGPLYGSTRGPI